MNLLEEEIKELIKERYYKYLEEGYESFEAMCKASTKANLPSFSSRGGTKLVTSIDMRTSSQDRQELRFIKLAVTTYKLEADK